MNHTNFSLQQISDIYKTGDINKAYTSLEQYILYNPNNKQAINLLQKIKKQVLSTNLKKIKEAISRFDYLEKEHRYSELLNAYLKIQKFAPDYAPIQSKIETTYKKVLQDKSSKDTQDYNQVKLITKTQIANKQLQEAIIFIEKALLQNPNNVLLQKHLLETKRQIIDIKLNSNNKAFHNLDTPKLYDFIKSLYEYEPTYPKIQKLLIKYHSLLKAYFANKKIVFEKDAERQIKVLYNQKQFQKCLQICNELLRTTIFNSTAVKYKKKATSAIILNNFEVAYSKLNQAST